MSKRRKRSAAPARAEPKRTRSIAFVGQDAWDSLECAGYTSLASNPEICTAVDTIARLVASMTIHLMENTDKGDIRIKNELSRKVDINPQDNMTRQTWVHWLVKTMMLHGNGNAVVWPDVRGGILYNLNPVPPALASFIPDGIWDYKVLIAGQEYSPDEVLHFVLNPSDVYPWMGTGYRVALADVANNLKQAAATEKGFMASKWKPSIIVKVDALVDEFSSPDGRRRLLESYASSGEAGEPWLIPAEQFSVEQVKPLTLSDLALADFVKLDKTTVATILGVPPFVLGVGDFKREAWNNFVSSTLMPIAKGIEQELSKKLLYKPEWFFRFNMRSLYNYDLKDLETIAVDLYVRGCMTGNEVRDWVGVPPMDGLDELVILENYIPRGMIADQSKLQGGE